MREGAREGGLLARLLGGLLAPWVRARLDPKLAEQQRQLDLALGRLEAELGSVRGELAALAAGEITSVATRVSTLEQANARERLALEAVSSQVGSLVSEFVPAVQRHLAGLQDGYDRLAADPADAARLAGLDSAVRALDACVRDLERAHTAIASAVANISGPGRHP